MRKLKPSRRSLIEASAFLVLAWPFGRIAMAAETDDVDLEALARLRPGAPAAALQPALGRHWRAPAPHKSGLVDIVENSHGFIARLDIDGIVREVIYSWRFDGRPFIDSLPLGRLWCGNVQGWVQFRKEFDAEDDHAKLLDYEVL